MAKVPARKGLVFTWGADKDTGALGHSVKDRDGDCPLPVQVHGPEDCVSVSAGPNLSAAVTKSGELWTWGKGIATGHGDENLVTQRPTLVKTIPHGLTVRSVSFGSAHALALCSDGKVLSWGSNRQGALGLGPEVKFQPTPRLLALAGKEATSDSASGIFCCDSYSAAIMEPGHLYTWGTAVCLGHVASDSKSGITKAPPSTKTSPLPQRVGGLLLNDQVRVVQASLGSLYMGCVDATGNVYAWGYGGHGNLGCGDRLSRALPSKMALASSEQTEDTPRSHLETKRAVAVACTAGQMSMGGGMNPKRSGQEGPHTLLIVRESEPGSCEPGGGGGGGGGGSGGGSQRLYTCGTCHKGLCGNLAAKTLQAPFDELTPFKVGSVLRDVTSKKKKKSPSTSAESKQCKVTSKGVAVVRNKGKGARPSASGAGAGAAEEKEEEEEEGVLLGGGCKASEGLKQSGADEDKEQGGEDAKGSSDDVGDDDDDDDEDDEEGPSGAGGGGRFDRDNLLGNVVGVASSSIHNLVWNDRGELWAFGCGSGGRCGVAYFVIGANPSKPRKSRMKAYMSSPNRVGCVWPPTPQHAAALSSLGLTPSLQGAFVRSAAASRYHGICVADFD